MPTLENTGAAAADSDEDLPRDSQFESFYDKDSGTWTLRRIPSNPPPCGADDAVADATWTAAAS